MAKPVRFRNNWWLLLCLGGCSLQQDQPSIPDQWFAANDPLLKQQNGFLWHGSKKISGWIYALYPAGDTALLVPYRDGKEEGWARKWYAGKQLMEERFFVAGKKEGRHRMWWPGGVKKAEYHFEQDEHEGPAQEWFSNGRPFRVFHYHKGHEAGRQQQWWEDGKVRANYVVKDGEQYGLIGRKACKNTKDAQN